MLDRLLNGLIEFYKGVAQKVYPYRYWFAVLTPAPFGSLVVALALGPQEWLASPLVPVIGPWSLVGTVWLWAIFLICIWFHPERGSLYQPNVPNSMFPPGTPKGAAAVLTAIFVVLPAHVFIFAY